MKHPILLPVKTYCYGHQFSIEQVLHEWRTSAPVPESSTHVQVALAAGWRLDDHIIGNTSRRVVLDELGRRRATVWADEMVLIRRFGVHEHGRGGKNGLLYITAQEPNPLTVLEDFGTCRVGDTYARDDLRAVARAWLDTHRPDHLNPFAYWND